ncbi:MAG: DUF177 domain-containing protein [bacterium]|nr:DUF177 domain-containing protein [bacterium]
MLINVSALRHREQRASLDTSFVFDNLEDLKLISPIKGKFKVLEISEEGFLSRIMAKGILKLECDRCLKEFNFPLNLNLITHFSLLEDEDSWPIEGNQIDLSKVVYEEISLNLPMKKICPNKCKSIKPKN